MRLLHTTDLHMNRAWFSWVTSQARKFDAVILSGDLLDMLQFDVPGHGARKQAAWVLDWVTSFPGRLFLCSGNHDFWLSDESDDYAEGGWLQLARRKGVAVDGDTTRLKGWDFYCKPWVGGLPPVDRKLVVVAHGPPEGTQVSTEDAELKGDFETTLVVRRLLPGSIVLSGHIHRPAMWHEEINGVDCFNAGYADPKDPEPNHIILDLDAEHADFHRFGRPVQTVSLNAGEDGRA